MKYTDKQREEIKFAQTAVCSAMKELLKAETEIRVDCPGDGQTVNVSTKGGNVTQLLLAAIVAGSLIKDDDIAHSVFISAMELYRGKLEDAPSEGKIKVEI